MRMGHIRLIFFYLVGLRYPPHFDFRKSTKEKKKDKMIGKVSETLQNDCQACCLHKKNFGKIYYNDINCIINDVLDQNSPSS